jgi:hypothetical protein
MHITLTNNWQMVADFNCTFQLHTVGHAEITLSDTAPTQPGLVIESLDLNHFEYNAPLKLWARSDRSDAVLTVVEV